MIGLKKISDIYIGELVLISISYMFIRNGHLRGCVFNKIC